MNERHSLSLLFNAARMARLTDEENANMKQAAQILDAFIVANTPKEEPKVVDKTPKKK